MREGMTYTKACVELARAYDAAAPRVETIRDAERVAVRAFKSRRHFVHEEETAIDVMLAEGRAERKKPRDEGPWF
jgi:hypothetical protein